MNFRDNGDMYLVRLENVKVYFVVSGYCVYCEKLYKVTKLYQETGISRISYVTVTVIIHVTESVTEIFVVTVA